MGECEMSRNAFNDCEREYNRKEEAIEMARKDQLDEQGRLNAMGQEREARLMAELAEAKRVMMQAIGLAALNKGKAEKHYERAEKAEAELADYKLWAEVEIADLREDLSDHIRMAKDAQEDAGRYRWMRNMNNDDAAMRCVQLCGAAMDEAIDEAIKRSAK